MIDVMSDEELLAVMLRPQKPSPTELAVLALVMEGYRDREVAELLFKSYKTVKCNVTNAMRKLHAPTRTKAVVVCLREGWLEL